MPDGIYTLANDAVYDQLVAFLNSVSVNDDRHLPVCVIPYDERVDKIREEISKRPGVMLLEDQEILDAWRDFSNRAWSAHPKAMDYWVRKHGKRGVHRVSCNHRYAAFDSRSPFDRFVYFDADILLLDSVARFFDGLQRSEVVVYDFQFKHPQHVYNLSSPMLRNLFDASRMKNEIFCSGCFASHRGMFDTAALDRLVLSLAEGESDVLYTDAPNQSLLNYMIMRSNTSVENLAHSLPRDEVTGSAVTSRHFQRIGGQLFDRGRRVNYLHYVGVDNSEFTRLAAGKDVDTPYGELFLHYRFPGRDA